MAEAFFKITKDALDQITLLCNLMHPISVSMWHLRSQVTDLYTQFPNAQNGNFDHFFAEGSGIYGTDYIKAFINTTWDSHEESIAWIFLNNIFAIYEGWLKGMHQSVFDAAHGNLSEKAMQFPEINRYGNGVIEELTRLTNNECAPIKGLFFNSYASRRHRCFIMNSSNELVLDARKLKNLVYCYRYFKELRNCYTHGGSIADRKTVDAYNAFKNHVSIPSDLGMDCIPSHNPPTEGNRVSVNRFGVIGFSQVVQMIMVTIDTMLLCSGYAEDKIKQEMVDRIKKICMPDGKRILKNIDSKSGFENKLIGLLMEAGYARTELRKKISSQVFDETGLNYIHQLLRDNSLIEMQNCVLR